MVSMDASAISMPSCEERAYWVLFCATCDQRAYSTLWSAESTRRKTTVSSLAPPVFAAQSKKVTSVQLSRTELILFTITAGLTAWPLATMY